LGTARENGSTRMSTEQTRGRRPAGAKAEAKLASWGPVDDQMPLFPGAVKDSRIDRHEGGAL
jgi:hypothetical protein